MPAKRGLSEYLEIRYSSEFTSLPNNLVGDTFSHIFGRNTSNLETLLIQAKMKGPSWITINGFKEVDNYRKSW